MTGTVITFAGVKGGVGKSTHAAALAFALAAEDHSVFALDLDPQGSLEYFTALAEPMYPNLRGQNKSPVVKDTVINSFIINAANEYDYVIIDTPGKASPTTAVCMVSADLVLLPFKLSVLDEQGMQATLDAFLAACDAYEVPIDERCPCISLYCQDVGFVSNANLAHLKGMSDDFIIRSGLRNTPLIADWMRKPYPLVEKSEATFGEKATSQQKVSKHFYDLASVVKGLFDNA